VTAVVGRTATDLSAAVRDGRLTAVEVTRAHLDHLAEVEHRLGAFVGVRRRGALDDAEAVDARDDRGDLPLAGVPIAVQDDVAIEGEPLRLGSNATPEQAAVKDHHLVARLKAAGAIIIGRTRSSELGLWGTSDDDNGVAVSPWDPTRSAGGSSGGAAGAVSAGIVPIALASDGYGSIRIPAAACGVVGLRPGADLLGKDLAGRPHWWGMSRYGPLATTVGDTALLLDVLVGADRFAEVEPLDDRSLSVAVSWRSPAPGVVVSGAWREAALEAGRLLNHAGHTVVHADPPYDRNAVQAVLGRWTQGAARDIELLELDVEALQPRTRAHAAAGERFQRVTPVREEDAERWRERVAPFLLEHDVLVTPAFSRAQAAAMDWRMRPWAANFASDLSTYPFLPAWNLADVPSMVVPMWHDGGRPLSVQLVARQGREDLLLSVAAQLESLVPWTRHAPGWGVPML
jgi:amidase